LADVEGEMADANGAVSETEQKQKATKQRDIPGNLTYTTSYGVLKRVLDGIITAERPDKFSGDFMSTVLNVTGGSARAVPPILKRMGFLSADGSPTDTYSRFKSDSGRSSAALEGLRKGFSEIFRRNDFAHRADQSTVKDIVVEITGLNKNDPVVTAIVGTFQSVRDYVDVNKLSQEEPAARAQTENPRANSDDVSNGFRANGISLVYNISIVLPETTNVQVFNAIFRSLKENLLDGQQ
jgi:Family of unknown function (DUF5343)